jgi:hypothetical protein
MSSLSKWGTGACRSGTSQDKPGASTWSLILKYDFYIKISTNALGHGMESWHGIQIKWKSSTHCVPAIICVCLPSPAPGREVQAMLAMHTKMYEAALHELMGTIAEINDKVESSR